MDFLLIDKICEEGRVLAVRRGVVALERAGPGIGAVRPGGGAVPRPAAGGLLWSDLDGSRLMTVRRRAAI